MSELFPSSADSSPPQPLPRDGDPARRWMRQLAQLRSRALKLKLTQSHAPAACRGVFDDLIELSEGILQDLAGAHLQVEQMSHERQEERDQWNYLFDHMLTACLVTDLQGTIVRANRAAALLLNLGSKSLQDRLLLHFVRERDAFQEILQTIRVDGTPANTLFTIRPRERAPVVARVYVCQHSPRDRSAWLWFLAAAAPATRGEPAVAPESSPGTPT